MTLTCDDNIMHSIQGKSRNGGNVVYYIPQQVNCAYILTETYKYINRISNKNFHILHFYGKVKTIPKQNAYAKIRLLPGLNLVNEFLAIYDL